MTHVRPYRAFVLCTLVSCAGLSTSLAGCAAEAPIASTSAPVVYEIDDRLDYFESDSVLFKGIARDSIVALISTQPGFLNPAGGGTYTPGGETLAEFVESMGVDPGNPSLPFCPGESFGNQPSTSFCSGTLIDDDLVLTAGHCVDEELICPDAFFVFDYLYASDGELEQIDVDDVYQCAEVVVRRLDPGAGQDYAILRLDRPVVGHVPADVDLGYGVAGGDSVTAIGFPSGIPAKIDEGGVVIDDRAADHDYFTATTDTFGGNSGSGVFDESGALVGILVRGATDYVSNGECIEVNVVDVGPTFDEGEDITYATNAVEALCKVVANGETNLCEDGKPIGAGGGGGTVTPGGGSGSSRGCAASAGSTSSASLASLLVVAGVLARRRRR